MNKNRIKGVVAKTMGAAKDVVGQSIGAKRLKLEGSVQKMSGSAQNAIGKMQDRFGRALR